jgi:hypothetical protein
MWHHQILRALLVRDLTIILLVGGLGVEDHQNGFREVPTLVQTISFCGFGTQTKPNEEDREHRMKSNNKHVIILPLTILTS